MIRLTPKKFYLNNISCGTIIMTKCKSKSKSKCKCAHRCPSPPAFLPREKTREELHKTLCKAIKRRRKIRRKLKNKSGKCPRHRECVSQGMLSSNDGGVPCFDEFDMAATFPPEMCPVNCVKSKKKKKKNKKKSKLVWV